MLWRQRGCGRHNRRYVAAKWSGACFNSAFDVNIAFSTADIISTVEFDQTGNYLATGDKGGRVVLFERNESVCYSRTPVF
jgi:hypothetical protein